MKKKIIILLASAFLAIIAVVAILSHVLIKGKNTNLKTPLPSSKEKQSKDTELSDSKDLDFSFAKLENNNKNMIYSPLSIKYALNMLRDGANGATKEELDSVLGDNSLTSYKNIEDTLSLTNALFIRDSFNNSINKDYKEHLSKTYNAELKTDSFKDATNINKWIEENSFGMLKDIINDSSVTDIQAALINVLAINMNWSHSFGQSSQMDFTLSDGTIQSVPNITDDFYFEDILYSNDEDFSTVTLPLREYNGIQLEFVGIMPKKQSLQDFIKNVDSDTVNNLINAQVAASKANTIELSMPVFNYDYTLSFVDDLNKLGINKAFDCNSSDLSKISEKNLYVSEAMHSAKINFHQEGIEAAGVTCLYMTLGISPYAPKESIIFDRPFFYIIRDVDTHDIFFVGTLYNPES